MSRVLFGALITFAFAPPLLAGPAKVVTYRELADALPADKAGRVRALNRFAGDATPALDDRIRAARALVRESEDATRAQAHMLEARLHGLVRAEKSRARALAKAAKAAAASPALSKVISRMQAADEHLVWVAHRVARRGAGPLSTKEKQRRDALLSTSKQAYRKTDPIRWGWARFEAARLMAASEGGEKRALSELNKLLRVGGRGRDGAPVRIKARRVRAKLLAKTGRLKDAVHESLVADRTRAVPLDKAMTQEAALAVRDRTHKRSRASHKLCMKAQAEGISCAALERKRMGGRSFYDFSREQTLGSFSEARAAAVMFEYEELLGWCVGKHKKQTRGSVIQIEWAVGHDGHVKDGKVYRPRRLREGKFGKCVSDALALFRYPPYRGEVHNHALEFVVPGR